MIEALALKRRREPDPQSHAVLWYSLIAATGFVAGWLTHGLGF